MRHFETAYGDMTWRELVEVGALDRIDPPIGQRLDYWLAVLCSVVANSRLAGKGARSFKPKDFMPDWTKPPKKVQTPEQMKAAFRAAIGR